MVKVLPDEESLSAKDPVNDFVTNAWLNILQSPDDHVSRTTISLPFSTWKKQYPNLQVVNPLPHSSEFRVKDFPFAAYIFMLNLLLSLFIHYY